MPLGQGHKINGKLPFPRGEYEGPQHDLFLIEKDHLGDWSPEKDRC